MYGTRSVVLLVEPTHPALAAVSRAGRRSATYRGGEALEEAMREIAQRAVARLLGLPPEPFSGLAD
jgi:hypothetical protein